MILCQLILIIYFLTKTFKSLNSKDEFLTVLQCQPLNVILLFNRVDVFIFFALYKNTSILWLLPALQLENSQKIHRHLQLDGKPSRKQEQMKTASAELKHSNGPDKKILSRWAVLVTTRIQL